MTEAQLIPALLAICRFYQNALIHILNGMVADGGPLDQYLSSPPVYVPDVLIEAETYLTVHNIPAIPVRKVSHT
jgi:hypothetical protein